MEARFCTKCGRPLIEGQICICQQQAIHTEEIIDKDKTETVTHQTAQETGEPEPTEIIVSEQQEDKEPQPETETEAEQAEEPQPEQETAASEQPEREAAEAQVEPAEEPQPEPDAAPSRPVSGQQEGGAQDASQKTGSQKEKKPRTEHKAEHEKEAEWFRQKKDCIAACAKKLWTEVSPLLREPTEGVQKLAQSGGKSVGFRLIVINTVVSLVVLLISLARINSVMKGLESVLDGYFGVQLPWFKSVILLVFSTFGVDCLEAALLKMLTDSNDGKMTMDAAFAIVGQKALFSMLTTVAAGMISLISVPFGVVILMIAAVCILIFEYSAYALIAENTSAKRMRAFMITKAIVTVVMFFIVHFMISGLLGGMLGTIGTSIGSTVIDALF